MPHADSFLHQPTRVPSLHHCRTISKTRLGRRKEATLNFIPMAASSCCISTIACLQAETPQSLHANAVRSALLHKSSVLRSVKYFVESHAPRAQKMEQSPAAESYVNKRPSPLARGGTLTGDKAAGKDPGLAIIGKVPAARSGSFCGPFQDARWRHGTWDLSKFTSLNGKVDWDAVIDAEILRRKWLEERPEASLNEDLVIFRTSTIPWWAWVRRFHLPEAELLNGRAAMIGFVMGYLVDGLLGVGLIDQTSSFAGKLLLLVTVLGVMLVRKTADVETLKQLAHEWTIYEKQWRASWQDEQIPVSEEVQ